MTLGMRSPGFYTRPRAQASAPRSPPGPLPSSRTGKAQRPGLLHTRPPILSESWVSVCPPNAGVLSTDIMVDTPDEQSIVTYVAQFLEHFPEPEAVCWFSLPLILKLFISIR